MAQKLTFLILLLFIFSCNEEDKREEEIAGIPVEVEILRFDQRFARATADSLQILKGDFPYLFPAQYPDSVWVAQMKDTIQLEINTEVAKVFPNLEETKQELHSLFQHVKYYFPETEIPKVVTLTSLVDYKNKVIWSDSLLLISLDTYLGENHHFYLGIQEYLKKNFKQEQIIPDAAAAFAETKLPQPDSRLFLDHVIYYGKILYLKDLIIPFKSDAQKIGYTEEELDWAEANEEQIWRYFVDKEMLFATDSDLYTRFLYPAPFSKFYLQLDNESPDRLGQFIGWQIVRQFMEDNEISVKEMLKTDAGTIFKKSNYKPRK
ncbi:MAG TPA: gliding motility lipoprotein GldB [Salinimicrobium sp.]|nr:gliding motility lipoprotein GldB [Salinimicrobium sp.]